jgi:hypothetical protein
MLQFLEHDHNRTSFRDSQQLIVTLVPAEWIHHLRIKAAVWTLRTIEGFTPCFQSVPLLFAAALKFISLPLDSKFS